MSLVQGAVMKSCPTCDLVYSHELLQFCRFDGARLVETYWGEATTQLLPLPQMPHIKAVTPVNSRTGELKNHKQIR